MPDPLSVIQVDASFYTGPYDAGLTEGLRANGVQVSWATRRPRPEETMDLPRQSLEHVFGGLAGGAKGRGPAAKLRSGWGYLAGWMRLLSMVERLEPDVLHIQWPLLPLADAAAIRRAQAVAPVVVTVHDLLPYNGAPTSRLQIMGLGSALRAADHLIVHTSAARETLLARGFGAERVSTIPHGPLRLNAPARPKTRTDARWTFVFFGKLQPYKGVEVLLEAAGLMDPAARARSRFIVAGEPLMSTAPLLARAAELGLSDSFEFRLHRQSDEEMAALFQDADAFVFPYLQIEASGVFALLRSFGKWVVASDLGAFREALADGAHGALVPPRDPTALSHALTDAVGRAPAPGRAPAWPSWVEIGQRTRGVYETVMGEHAANGHRA
jgi:glycosyltransferase involved in cell wall biosynthesis